MTSQSLVGVYPTAHHLREAVSAWVVARLGSGPGAMSGINLQMEKYAHSNTYFALNRTSFCRRKGKVGELVLRCQRAGHPKKKKEDGEKTQRDRPTGKVLTTRTISTSLHLTCIGRMHLDSESQVHLGRQSWPLPCHCIGAD